MPDVKLPMREFLYTLDQISYLISVEVNYLKKHYIHLHGSTPGVRSPQKMLARNISNTPQTDWRVAETEFKRWLRAKGFKIQEDHWIKR